MRLQLNGCLWQHTMGQHDHRHAFEGEGSMAQTVDSTAQSYTTYDIESTQVVHGHSQAVARGGMLTVLVHRWPSGGEVQLHTHPFQDAAWTVIQGHVKFYGEKDV